MTCVSQSIAPVKALLLSTAILLMGNGLQGTLLPLRASLEAFSNVEIAILGSSYFLGFIGGCLIAPKFIVQVGHIRAYLAFVSIASTVSLLHVLLIDVPLWWVFRALTGFCFSALFVIIESWLSERSDHATRGTIFSIYTIIHLTVVTAGQLMLTFGDPKTFSLFALASILISLAAVPVAMTRSPSPDPVLFHVPRLDRLYYSAPIGFVGCLSYGLTIGAFWSLGPVFAVTSGLDATGVGLFMSATVLGGAAGQWPLGRMSDHIDRRVIILITCVASTIIGIALSSDLGNYDSQMPVQIFVLGFVFGAFAYPLYALSVAHANDLANGSDYVETSSGLLLIFSLGATLGPIMASLVIGFSSYHLLFYFTAFVHILTAAFAALRMIIRGPIRQDAKVDFNEALVAARTVAPVEIIEPHDKHQVSSSFGGLLPDWASRPSNSGHAGPAGLQETSKRASGANSVQQTRGLTPT